MSSEFNTEHFEIIQQYVQINDLNNNDNMINVTIHKSEESNIYIHNHSMANKLKHTDTIHAFYIALNCEFADWTMNNMYDLIMSTPWVYGSQIQNNFNLNKNEFQSYFERSVQNIIIIVNKYIGRFINILHNFISINSQASYYTNTATLKSLLSLKYIFNFILLNSNNKYKLDIDTIIRSILLEVNALQSFSSMNCKQKSSHRNLHFYGYWITAIDEVLVGVDTIENFLFNIKEIKLESDLRNNYCSVTQMFLENTITIISSNDHISLDIVNAKLQFTNTDKISIKDILARAKTSYDIVTLFQYLDAVLSTIMKLIYTKIIYVLKTDENVPSTIIEKIKKINKLISTNTTNLPVYLIDGFTILTNIDIVSANHNSDQVHPIKKDVIIKEIQKYSDSLSNIILFEERDTPLTDEKPTVLCNNTVKSNKMTLKDCIIVYMTERDTNWTDSVIDLEKIMTKILDNFDDFECSNKLYKYLRNGHDNYHNIMSFIDNKKAPLPYISIKDNNQFDRVCDLILNTYSICWQAINITNGSRTTNNKSSNQNIENEMNFNSAWKFIDNINQDHFISIIESDTSDLNLLKMAYNIVIILVNIQNKSGKQIEDYHLKRILNMILTEMNNYGLKYCSKFDFLLFNNMDFINFNKDGVTLNYYLQNSTKINKYNYLNVRFLYDRFIKNSDVVKLYGFNIKFSWNEKKQTLQEIYKSAMYITLNIHSLYVLYDIYFKFYLAVIYYEIRAVLLKETFSIIKKKMLKVNNTLNDFKHEYFPNILKPLLSDIKKLLELPEIINEEESVKLLESKIIISIDEQFKKFNIFFEKPSTLYHIIKQGAQKLRIKLFSDSSLARINYELSNNVNIIHNNFLIIFTIKTN